MLTKAPRPAILSTRHGKREKQRFSVCPSQQVSPGNDGCSLEKAGSFYTSPQGRRISLNACFTGFFYRQNKMHFFTTQRSPYFFQTSLTALTLQVAVFYSPSSFHHWLASEIHRHARFFTLGLTVLRSSDNSKNNVPFTPGAGQDILTQFPVSYLPVESPSIWEPEASFPSWAFPSSHPRPCSPHLISVTPSCCGNGSDAPQGTATALHSGKRR